MPTQPRNVLNVQTLKSGDNYPPLSTTIEDINEAEEQPTEDTSFERYDSETFENASRIELHLDYWDGDGDDDPDGSYFRVADGIEAEWDSQNDEVSVKLDRAMTAFVGVYSFEWVLVHDEEDSEGDVPTSDEADTVQTVPKEGYFELETEEPTQRDLPETSYPDRGVNDLTVSGTLRGDENGAVSVSAYPSEEYDIANQGWVNNVVGTVDEAVSTHSEAGTTVHEGQTVGSEETPAEAVNASEAFIAEQLGIPVYSNDADAPTETHYFNDTDSTLKYKDSDGAVHSGGGGFDHTLSEALNADGNDIENVGALRTDRQWVRDGDDTDYPEVNSPDPLTISPTSGSGSAIGLIPRLDRADARTRLRYYNHDGNILAQVDAREESGDGSDPRFGVYTRGDGGTLKKRMDIFAGSDLGSGRFRMNSFGIEGEDGDSTRFEIVPAPDMPGDFRFFRDGSTLTRIRADSFGDVIISNSNFDHIAAWSQNSQLWEFRSNVEHNQNPVYGLREIENPSPSDLENGEWAWDSTDDRWLFKAQSGTVHFFEPDGTLT